MPTDAAYRATATIELDGIQIEHLEQDAGSGYTRLHNIARPTLVYIMPTGDRPALGSFEAPATHREFKRFGTMLALPPGRLVHVFSPPSRSREMIVLRFDTELWSRMAAISETLEAISFERWGDIHSPGLLDALQRIALEVSNTDRAQAAVLTGLSLVALGELVRHLEGHVERGKGLLTLWQLHKIEERVAHPGSPPSVEELAALCRISARHLMRLFKATTGSTLKQLIDRARFEQARKQLESGASVKAAAIGAGFANQSAFTASFKRIYKMTPSEFRRHCRVEGLLDRIDPDGVCPADERPSGHVGHGGPAR